VSMVPSGRPQWVTGATGRRAMSTSQRICRLDGSDFIAGHSSSAPEELRRGRHQTIRCETDVDPTGVAGQMTFRVHQLPT